MSAKNVARRLAKLERADAKRKCPVCNGAGLVTTVHLHREPEPEKPEGCPACGDWTLIIVERVDYVQKNLNMSAQVRYCSKAELRT